MTVWPNSSENRVFATSRGGNGVDRSRSNESDHQVTYLLVIFTITLTLHPHPQDSITQEKI
jgi:hypothetical protein